MAVVDDSLVLLSRPCGHRFARRSVRVKSHKSVMLEHMNLLPPTGVAFAQVGDDGCDRAPDAPMRWVLPLT